MKTGNILSLLTASLLAGILFFPACGDDEDDDARDCEPAPLGCQTFPYTHGTLNISVTINGENPSVNIYIYEGTIEGPLYKTVTGNSHSVWSSTEPMGDYAAKVDYRVGSVTVTAVDGDAISSTSTDHCNNITCYGVDNADLDLTFDYDAFKEFLEGSDEECFIATAAFGSPLAEEVKALREFRDVVMRKTAPGRAFIGLYYRYSPAIASFIRRHENLRTATRWALHPVVACIACPRAALGFFLIVVGAVIAGMAWSSRMRPGVGK